MYKILTWYFAHKSPILYPSSLFPWLDILRSFENILKIELRFYRTFFGTFKGFGKDLENNTFSIHRTLLLLLFWDFWRKPRLRLLSPSNDLQDKGRNSGIQGKMQALFFSFFMLKGSSFALTPTHDIRS